MASGFHLQKPYVVATLPRPLDHADRPGQYVSGEVFGQQRGSKKRKRSEISVGIDGDAVNIYDIPSARLVTSYPIPPHARFTCVPCSLRRKTSSSKVTTRYTYVSTEDPEAKVTLFKDIVPGAGSTASITTVSKAVAGVEPIIYISTLSAPEDTTAPNFDVSGGPVIVVLKDGKILCLDGETLDIRWRTPPLVLAHGLSEDATTDFCVEHVQPALAADVIDGLFLGRQDVFSVYQEKIERDAFNPDVLLVVTQRDKGRCLHVLAVTPAGEAALTSRPSVVQVYIAPLPAARKASGTPGWQFDVTSGHLQEQRGSTVVIYDLITGIPRVQSVMEVPGVKSWLRLSASSALALSDDALSVYNPAYQALQATTDLDLDATRLQGTQNEVQSTLVTHLRHLNLAVAIQGRSLIAVQLDAPAKKSRKHRTEGLLIDAIGRGISQPNSVGWKPKLPQGFSSFVKIMPGSLSRSYEAKWTTDVQKAEEHLANGDYAAFERLMAAKLGMKLLAPAEAPNGVVNGHGQANGNSTVNGAHHDDHALPPWIWLKSQNEYPQADRRWICFAIQKVFSWRRADETAPETAVLHCQLPESNVLLYLLYSGSLTTPNIHSAFKDQLGDMQDPDINLAGQIPRELADADPTMGLLLAYLHSTTLGPRELLVAIRIILYSLELVPNQASQGQKLLTLGDLDDTTADEPTMNGHVEGQTEVGEPPAIGMELDRLEQELEITAAYLGDGSMAASARAQCLGVAFAQLGRCPATPTVQTLRALYMPEETLALIQVLRVELIRDGWTTRYQDTMARDYDDNTEDQPPDGSVRVIADLLCRCVDSVGAAGWLVNDGILAGAGGVTAGSADFLAALKLEVSAALEGIQEALYLRGILTETVRYGLRVQEAQASDRQGRESGKASNKRVHRGRRSRAMGGLSNANESETPNAARELQLQHRVDANMQPTPAATGLPQALPMGLKVRPRISPEKIVSGGEIAQRSRREKGHLTSQHVGPYSLERIEI